MRLANIEILIAATNALINLIAAIYAFLDAHNADPKPFVWTASAEKILEKVRRGRAALRQAAASYS